MFYVLVVGLSELTTTLHVLNFLKSALSAFPEESVKSCCESILGLMAAGNVVRICCH